MFLAFAKQRKKMSTLKENKKIKKERQKEFKKGKNNGKKPDN